LRVKEITNEKHPHIYPEEPATKARATIRDLALRILPVVDEHRRLLGIVSRADVMAISSSVSPITVKGIMTNAEYIATMDEDAFSAVKDFVRRHECCAPVVNSAQDKTYSGVLGLESFIDAIIRISPEKLSAPVSEIMSDDVAACSPEDELDNVWRRMQTKSLSGCPVVRKEKLVGIVTEKDFLEKGSLLPTFESKKGRFKASSEISSIMKTPVMAVKPSIKAIRVAKIMVSKDIGRVPVVDEDGKLLGVVDREDIARLIVK